MIGRTYWVSTPEPNCPEPVVVLARWNATPAPADFALQPRPNGKRPKTCGPQNVLIRYRDGRRVVRPFRGLRRSPIGKHLLHKIT